MKAKWKAYPTTHATKATSVSWCDSESRMLLGQLFVRHFFVLRNSTFNLIVYNWHICYLYYSYINRISPDVTCHLYILRLCHQIGPNTFNLLKQSDVLLASFDSQFLSVSCSWEVIAKASLDIQYIVVKSRYLSGKGYTRYC